MHVTRPGTAYAPEPRTFDVADDPATHAWSYWTNQFAAGVWEPETFAVLDRYADPARDFVDVGAWVGPVSLWALGRYRRVVAIEPDLAALAVLTDNLRRNRTAGTDVVIEAAAVASGRRLLTLTRHGQEWGNSMATTRTHARPDHGLDDPTAQLHVAAAPLPDILPADTEPALIKMDVEGAEADILPAHVEFFRAAGCPLIIGLHHPFLADPGAVWSTLRQIGRPEIVGGSNDFPSVLVLPR